MARKVVRAFGQTMCGFDILRSNGGSYICDVNGWASVKDSPKFWDDAARLLRSYCLQAVAPSHYVESLSRGPGGGRPDGEARREAWAAGVSRPFQPTRRLDGRRQGSTRLCPGRISLNMKEGSQ